MSQDYKYIINIISKSNAVFPYLNRINTQIVFFIDNVDEYFRPVLEDRSARTTGRHSLYRNRSNSVWSLAQIALASVAYELEKTNHHIKIYCTIRHEAFLKMPEVESDAFQISGRCTNIEYTRDDLEKIFLKNIDITAKERLVDPEHLDAMLRLVGEANKAVEHRFVSRPEAILDYFLRHTLYRPRDLMFIGGEIVKIDPRSSAFRPKPSDFSPIVVLALRPLPLPPTASAYLYRSARNNLPAPAQSGPCSWFPAGSCDSRCPRPLCRGCSRCCTGCAVLRQSGRRCY